MPNPPDSSSPDFSGQTWQVGPWNTGIPMNPNTAATLAGYGKSIYDIGRATGQHLVNPVYRMATGHDFIPQADIDEASRRDQPLMANPYGKTGYIAGSAMNMLPASAAIAASLPETAAGGLAAAGINAARNSRWLAPVIGGGLANAGYGVAAQPTLSGETTAGNAGENFALGSLGQMGGAALGAALRPARDLVVDPVRRSLVQAADYAGIPLRRSQITGNPVTRGVEDVMALLPGSGRGATDTAQREAYGTALNKTYSYGQPSSTVGPDVGQAVEKSRKALGSVYENLSKGEKLYVSQGDLDALNQHIGTYAEGAPDENGLKQLTAWRDNFMNRYAATGGNGIPGEQYQNFRSTLNNKSVATKLADPDQSRAWAGLRDTVDNAMMVRLPADKQAAWGATNQAWANMKAVAPTIPKSQPGVADVAVPDVNTVARTLRSQRPRNAYNASQMNQPGATGNKLTDVAKVGEKLLGTPMNPTFEKLMHYGTGIAGPAAIGGYVASEMGKDADQNRMVQQTPNFFEAHPWLTGTAAGLGSIALGGTAGRFINSPEERGYLRPTFSAMSDYLGRRGMYGAVPRAMGAASKASSPAAPPPGQASAPAAGGYLPPGVQEGNVEIPADVLQAMGRKAP
jgi:hypothetical protein